MVKMSVLYTGQKHCDLVHEPSKTKISTDAPKDNGGRGEAFSPTDLVGAALASCIVTTMAIVAQRDGIPFEGARAEVQKEMNPHPRRIGSLSVKIWVSKSIPQDYRAKLEHAAHACPVHKSMHPDVQMPIEII